MKLYIPTSSRNFNCLLSEECISPKSFYGERGFGYSKWHSIPENPYEHLIVLYDDLKYFNRPNEGFDDYPLVIEVNVDDHDVKNLFRKDSNGTYLYDGTLYFNPKTTSFIFFSEQHKKIVLSKAEGSLETKLVRIYYKKIRVERPGGNYKVPQVQDAILNSEELDKSIRINKVKGFIYGYHIGNLLSVSKEQGFQIKTNQALLDLASAIYGSIDKRPTPQQKSLLQRTLLQNSSLANLLLDKTKLDADTISSLIDLIVNQCLWEPSFKSPDKNVLNLYYLILNPDTQEQAINYLTSRSHQILDTTTTHIVPEIAKDINVLPNNIIELPVLNLNHEDKATAELWVNGELANNKYKGSLASYRLDLATELTKSVRDNVYKDRWETSSTKPFLNAVRRNLNGEEFTGKWSEDTLSAIAAVLMKGDTWEGLRLFLISKGIQNQTMPFAFYGMINGFANLPKDFTNVLLNNQDNKGLWTLLNSAVYNAINGLGMRAFEDSTGQTAKETRGIGGELKGVMKIVIGSNKEDGKTTAAESIANSTVSTDSPLNTPSIESAGSSTDEDMPDFLSEQVENESVINDNSLRNSPTPHKYFSLWEYCARSIENTTVKKKDEFVKYYSAEVDKVFESHHSLISIKNGLNGISSLRGTKEAWSKSLKTILKEIGRIEEEEMREEMITQPSLWTSIIDDPHAVDYVGMILEKSPIKNAVVDNFKHIQKGYQPGGFYYKRNDFRDNSNIIDHFERWCFSDKNTYKKIQHTTDAVDDVKKVVDFLKQKYL